MALRTDTVKRRAAIYRQAARSIENGADLYSCIAVMNACDDDKEGAKLAGKYVDVLVYGLEDDDWPSAEGRLQITGFAYGAREVGVDEVDLRVLALCFMAAMVETGDAP